jgi:glucose/arabinose dehydrogenase
MKTLLALLFAFVLCNQVFAQSSADSLIRTDLIVPARFQALFDSAHSVLLPAGFRCSVFYAGNLGGPRSLAIDPNGRVCVADRDRSMILALPDPKHKGYADTTILLANDDSNAHGFAFFNGALYTAAANFVRKYEHQNGAGLYQDSSVFIPNIPYKAEGTPNHTTRTILFDTVGKHIYISVGAPCNACREIDTERAAILRFGLDGGGRTLYATGLRNAVGLTMDYTTNTLWASVAERNALGEDLPGEPILRVTQNGFYGWPLAYGDHQWDNFQSTAEYKAMLPITHADSVKVANMTVPDMFVPAHTTPLGVAVYHASQFPAEYQSNLFITLHGSAKAEDGRLVANGSSIVRAIPDGSKWILKDFALGFLTDSINYKRWARPCGIVIDSEGNIYFSSDNADAHTPPAVYKISYVGAGSVQSLGTSYHATTLTTYPNPVDRICTFELYGEMQSTGSLLITDVVGRTIASITTTAASETPGTTRFTFDMSRLAPGIYFAQLQSKLGVVRSQFVIVH